MAKLSDVKTPEMEFEELSASPASPPAGTLLVYAKNDGKIYTKNSAGTETEIGAGGALTLLQLTDSPSSYTDQAGKVIAVKETEDGVEFVDAPSGGGDAAYGLTINWDASTSTEGQNQTRTTGGTFTDISPYISILKTVKITKFLWDIKKAGTYTLSRGGDTLTDPVVVSADDQTEVEFELLEPLLLLPGVYLFTMTCTTAVAWYDASGNDYLGEFCALNSGCFYETTHYDYNPCCKLVAYPGVLAYAEPGLVTQSFWAYQESDEPITETLASNATSSGTYAQQDADITPSLPVEISTVRWDGCYDTDTYELFIDSVSQGSKVVTGGTTGEWVLSAPLSVAKDTAVEFLVVGTASRRFKYRNDVDGVPLSTGILLHSDWKTASGSNLVPFEFVFTSVLLTELTAASGSQAYPVYNPCAPPETPDSMDDEFDDTSLDVKWSWANQGSAAATLGDLPSLLKMVGEANANWRTLVQTAPTGDWEAIAKVHYGGNFIDDAFAGIVMLPATDGGVEALAIGKDNEDSPIRIRGERWTNFTTWGALRREELYGPTVVFLKVAWNNTAGTLTYYLSTDGVAYVQLLPAFTPSITIGRIGLGVRGSTLPQYFEFFRVS